VFKEKQRPRFLESGTQWYIQKWAHVVKVSFEHLCTDDDEMVELVVCASNGRQTGTMRVYLNPDDLRTFGAQLQSFPTDMDQVVSLESGGVASDWYGHFLMRAFVLDTSRCALEVLMDSRGEPPSEARLHFFVELEAACANRLGRAIEGWDVLNAPSLVFTENGA